MKTDKNTTNQSQENNELHQKAATHLWRLQKIEELEQKHGSQLAEFPAWKNFLGHFQAMKKKYNQYKAITPTEQQLAPLKPMNSNSGGLEIAKEDIDCRTFSSAVTKWHIAMNSFFQKGQKKYAAVTITTKKFTENFALHQSPLPIVSDLYQEWNILLSSLPDTVTGQKFFEQLLQHKGPNWQLTNDLEALETHYKRNRKTYKKYESTMESFRDEEMPKEQYFLDALAIATSEDDPNLPENVEEAMADSKKELKRWEARYENWLTQTIANLNKEDTSTTGRPINKDELETNCTTRTGAPTYAQKFWQQTTQRIKDSIQAESGVVLYEKATVIAVEIVREEAKSAIDEAFIKQASQSDEKELPFGLQAWLAASLDGKVGIYADFKEEYTAWTAEIVQMVSRCEDKLNSRNFKVEVQKLAKELEAPLTFEVNGQQAGTEILRELIAALPKEKVVDFESLKQAWKRGVTQLQKEAFLQEIWTTIILSEQAGSGVEQAMVDFFTNAPTLDEFVSALEDSRYQRARTVEPTLQEQGNRAVIQASVVVEWQAVPVLFGEAAGQISEETGLEGLAAVLRNKLGMDGEIDTSGGIENIVVRLTENLELDVLVPMKIIQSKESKAPIVVPRSLEPDSVKFTNRTDEYYQMEILRLYTDMPEPVQVGRNQYEQRLFIATQVLDSSITVGLAGDLVFVGANVEVSKNAKKSSIDFELLIESSYDSINNTYRVQFSRTDRNVEDYGGIVNGMTIPFTNELEIAVYR
ncbi:MAG: hypothetical protein ACRBFS_13745 [Aureispira sp.]